MHTKWKLGIMVVLAVVVVHAYGLGMHLVIERLAAPSGEPAASHNPNVITRTTIDGGVMTISFSNFNPDSGPDCPD